jgi:hypothetical protein
MGSSACFAGVWTGRRCDASVGTRLRRHEMVFKVAARRAAVRVCRIARGSEYSRGAVELLRAIGRRKSSESLIGITKEGKVNQQPESSAIREHPAPAADGCGWRIEVSWEEARGTPCEAGFHGHLVGIVRCRFPG